jgi:hemolysin-activating ACP:hemolysin acyltransferase
VLPFGFANRTETQLKMISGHVVILVNSSCTHTYVIVTFHVVNMKLPSMFS